MKGSNLIRNIFQFVECSQAGTSKEIIIEDGFEELQNLVIFNWKVRVESPKERRQHFYILYEIKTDGLKIEVNMVVKH